MTERWVIVATARAGRPHELKHDRVPAERTEDCPFCPGHEEETPPETFAIRLRDDPGDRNRSGWTIRVMPNKFPALSPDAVLPPDCSGGPFERLAGEGYHEVIVDTPIHDLLLGDMPVEDLTSLLTVYRHRYLAHLSDPRVEYVQIFRNHGREAGASRAHPHSQVIAMPTVPPDVEYRWCLARRYHQRTGSNLLDYLLTAELQAQVRVVSRTEHFTAFVPFAAATPFETWIVPLDGPAAFADIGEAESTDLARILKDVLRRLEIGLNDPPYNYMIHSAPPSAGHDAYCRWYLRIAPKLGELAGFELSTGVCINTVCPEDAAEFLRGIEV